MKYFKLRPLAFLELFCLLTIILILNYKTPLRLLILWELDGKNQGFVFPTTQLKSFQFLTSWINFYIFKPNFIVNDNNNKFMEGHFLERNLQERVIYYNITHHSIKIHARVKACYGALGHFWVQYYNTYHIIVPKNGTFNIWVSILVFGPYNYYLIKNNAM